MNEESVKEHPLLRLFRFFIDKESSLLFRFKNNETNEYIFSIEARPIIEERYQTYHEIFMNAGFSEVDRETSDNRHEWIIKSNDLDSLMNQIHSSFSIIMESFPLNIETTEDQILNFNALARFKMRELSKEEFDKWLKKKKEEMN